MNLFSTLCSIRPARYLAGLTLAGILTGCASPGAPKESSAGRGPSSLTEPDAPTPANSGLAEALAWFDRALVHELNEDLPAAVEAYRRGVQLAPDNGSLYLIASERLLRAEQTEAAFDLLDTLLERDPDNLRALRWMARLHIQNEDETKALDFLERAVALHPASEIPYLRVIRMRLQKDEVDPALHAARLAVTHADSPVRSTLLLAQLLLRESGNARDLITMQAHREEAEEVIARAIDRFPEREEFLLLSIELHAREKKMDQVVQHFHHLDERAKDPEAARERMLVTFLQAVGETEDHPAKAVSDIFEKRSEDALVQYLLGVLRENAGAPEAARDAFETALTLAPEDRTARRKLALLHFRQERPARALALLEDLLEQKPDDTELLLLSAHMRLATEQFEKAAHAFDQLEHLLSKGAAIERPERVHSGRAMARLALGNINKAADAMYQTLVESPESLETIWRHQLRLALMDREDAPEHAAERERHLLEALAILSNRIPGHPTPQLLIANTHSFRGDPAKAIEAMERTKALAEEREDPSTWLTPGFYFDLGTSLERAGRIEEAVDTFQKVLEMEPDHAPALNYLAYMWAERGKNLDQALSYVQRALEQDPENGSYIDTLGWVYFQQEKYEQAYDELLKAAEQIPDESVVAEHLGDVLLKLDRPVEALGYYRIALELGPGPREETVKESIQKAEQALADQSDGDAESEEEDTGSNNSTQVAP